jgi:tetratricopeptide (TPR) repeat protein
VETRLTQVSRVSSSENMVRTIRRGFVAPLFFSLALFSQSPGDDLQRYWQDGEQALAAHRYADAQQSFEKLRQLAPGTAEVYGRLGLVYFQEGKFEQAVPALRQALKLKPALPNTDILLATSLSELGHYEEALPGLEKGFRSLDQPLKRMSGLQLVRAYTGLQRDSKAVDVALELNRLFPNDPEILYQSSRIYANFAYLTLRKLADVAPSSLWRHQAAAEAYESQGTFDLAISEYREVLAIDPARPGIHYRIGRVLLSRSRSGQSDSQAEALKEFELELQLDSTNANAAYEIGEIYRKSGQLDKAHDYFNTALKTYSDFEEAQLGIAGVLMAQGKPDLALPYLRQAIALNPGDEVSYYRLAQVYKAQGNLAGQEKALAEFRRLRNRKPLQSEPTGEFRADRDVTKQEIDGNVSR